MEYNYDINTIADFFEKITDLKNFCTRYKAYVEKETKKEHPLLGYVRLDGGNDGSRSQCLVTREKTAGKINRLIYYLTHYWFDIQDGTSAIFIESKMDHELFLAAHELWTMAEKEYEKEIGLKAFEQFAAINPDFKQQWPEIKRYVIKNRDFLDAASSGFLNFNSFYPMDKYPYTVCQSLRINITTASSIEDIQVQMKKAETKGLLTPENKNIIEKLGRSAEERLFIDFFLIPLSITEQEIDSINKYFLENHLLPDTNTTSIETTIGLQRILRRAQQQLLTGKTEEAIDTLKKELAKHATDASITHFLGLIYLSLFNTYLHTAPVTAFDDLAGFWQKAVCHLAVSLAETGYWMEWGRNRYKQYKRDFMYASFQNLKKKIYNYLAGILKSFPAQNYKTDSIKQLRNELTIEWQAVSLSQALGGIKTGNGKMAWFGPLWMKEYNMEDILAAYIKEISESPRILLANPLFDEVSIEYAIRRLRGFFSYLAEVLIYLETITPQPGGIVKNREEQEDMSIKTDPEKALEILTSTGKNFPDCKRNDCPIHGESKIPIAICCPYNEEFTGKNHAYKAFSDPVKWLCEDVYTLNVDANLKLIEQMIAGRENINPATIKEKLKNTISLIQSYTSPKKFYKKVYDFILASTVFITDDIDKLSIGIILLDMGYTLLSEDFDKKILEDRLVKYLYSRGMVRSELGDVKGSAADMKRALSLQDFRHDIRAALVGLLTSMAGLVSGKDRFLAVDYIRQAEEIINEGKKKYKVDDWEELLQNISKSRNNLLGIKDTNTGPVDSKAETQRQESFLSIEGITDPVKLFAKGVRAMRAGRIEFALEIYEKAIKYSKTSDKEIESGAAEALMAKIKKQIEEGKDIDWDGVINKWEDKLTTQKERIEQQIEFMKYWDDIYSCLENQTLNTRFGSLPYTLEDFKQVIIQFEGNNNIRLAVFFRVQRDILSLNALLPFVAFEQSETAYKNILIACGKIPLFKPVFEGLSELVLSTCIKANFMKDFERFFLLIWDISGFADITSDQIMDLDSLKRWFREKWTEIHSAYSNPVNSNSGDAFKNLCKDRDIPFQEVSSDYYKIAANCGELKMKPWSYGSVLSAYIGILPSNTNKKSLYEKMIQFNTENVLGKLTLDKEDRVFLSIELPYFDNSSAIQAYDLIEKLVPRIRKEFNLPEGV